MTDPCAHRYPDGRPCRRVPRRGQPFCPAHRPNRVREEKEAALALILGCRDELDAMSLAGLLFATSQALANIHSLIERKSSRRHRADFLRAVTAVCLAAHRVDEFLAESVDPPETAAVVHPRPAGPIAPRPRILGVNRA